MPGSGFFSSPRRLYALFTVLSALLLAAALVVLPGVGRAAPLVPVLAGIAVGGLVISLMLLWSPGLLDTYPRNKTLRILFESVPPLLLYMLAMNHWPELLARIPAGGLQVAAACMPALLVVWMCWAFARYLRLLDELQQRIELLSVALAAALTGILAATAGTLHGIGVVRVSGEAGLWIFPLLGLAYSLIRAALTRRYQ